MKSNGWNTALLLLLYIVHISALPDTITIGGIFGSKDERQRIAFRYAVEAVNADRNILRGSRLVGEEIELHNDDSFHANKKVCSLLRNGVAAIFGPQSEDTANHVQSICDTLEVPHIEMRWDYKLERNRYSINLYPHPGSLGKAYHSILLALGWKKFTILYEDNESLVRMQDLLKERNFQPIVRQLEETQPNDYRPLLKEIKRSQMTHIVLDVSMERLPIVLRQAKQIGLMTEYHHFFITTLDFHLVDLEDFKYGGTNLTALQMIDPWSPELMQVVTSWRLGELRFSKLHPQELMQMTTEAALMYDAVKLFAKALANLDQANAVDIGPLYCEGDKPWQHGNSLINYMKWEKVRGANQYQYSSRPPSEPGYPQPVNTPYRTSYNYSMAMPRRNQNMMESVQGFPYGEYNRAPEIYGLTGLIKFDAQGFRNEFQMNIVEMNPVHTLKKVGVWSLYGGANYTRNQVEENAKVDSALVNKTLRVTTALASPYTMLAENAGALTGNDRFEGFCIDLIHAIAAEGNFNVIFQQVKDGAYGSRNSEGEWNGMIRELLDHRADMGIVDFTITFEREEAVDFSMPFMNLGISIIYKKPTKKAPSLFSFASPFSLDVWIYMATAYLGVSVLLFILARAVPDEWEPGDPCDDDPEELENGFTLLNSLWFVFGTFVGQGADVATKAVSTRIVAGIWWFFTLIMISSYTANLAAFLTVERMDAPITGAEDLAKQTKIKYGLKDGGSTHAFFKNSNIETYKKMWTAMANARPSVFTSSNDEGVMRVSKDDGAYAFLMESSSIEYEVERRCDLMQIGGLLDSKSYGIALPPKSPYTSAISSAILKLKEGGQIHTLKKKWWNEMRGGGICKPTSGEAPSAELRLANLAGVFVVVTAGSVVAVFVACCEFFWKARKLATCEGQSFSEELMKELKFSLSFGENEKPVRKPPDTSSRPTDTDSSTIYSQNYGYSGSKK